MRSWKSISSSSMVRGCKHGGRHPQRQCSQCRVRPHAGVDGSDLAAPTVTCKLDEASGTRMYNLTYRVKGTRAGQLA